MEAMEPLILSPTARRLNFYFLTISRLLFNSGSVWTISQRMRLSSAFFAVKIEAINNPYFGEILPTYVQVIAEQPA
jgi:hypothetical protein